MTAFHLWDKPMPKGETVPSVVARHLRRKATQSRGPVAKARRAKAAKDKRVADRIRAKCVTRDGYCRIETWEDHPYDVHADNLDPCEGVSEWAHLGEKKRFKTRGLPPEERHTTAGSLMLCTHHHDDYDDGRLVILGTDANDTLQFWPAPYAYNRPSRCS